MMKGDRNIWDEETGLINQFRFFQTSPNILFFSIFNNRNNSAKKIRFYFAHIFWKRFNEFSLKQKLRVLSHFILWPYYWRKYAKQTIGDNPYEQIKKNTGKSFFRQRWEQFYLAFFYSISVKEYYMYEFFKKNKRMRASEYLMRLTFKPLIYSFLDKVYLDQNPLNKLSNQDSKNDFEKKCVKHNIRSVPVYAHISNSNVGYLKDKEQIINSDEDLFIKPEQSRGGHGAEIWFKEKSFYINNDGIRLDFDELISFYQKKEATYFASSDYIIQPRLRNHSELDFGVKALSTLRINTFLNTDGVVNILFAVLRFSSNNTSNVDNFHAGGMVAGVIDLDKGKLGTASQMSIQEPGMRILKHPLSQKQIQDLVIPYWKEAIELVKKAHVIGFSERSFIGWDVAITNEGPILIECNGWPDNELIQTGYNTSLSHFNSFELFATKLEDDFRKFYKKK